MRRIQINPRCALMRGAASSNAHQIGARCKKYGNHEPSNQPDWLATRRATFAVGSLGRVGDQELPPERENQCPVKTKNEEYLRPLSRFLPKKVCQGLVSRR